MNENEMDKFEFFKGLMEPVLRKIRSETKAYCKFQDYSGVRSLFIKLPPMRVWASWYHDTDRIKVHGLSTCDLYHATQELFDFEDPRCADKVAEKILRVINTVWEAERKRVEEDHDPYFDEEFIKTKEPKKLRIIVE